MAFKHINFNPSKKDLRVFGAGGACILPLVAFPLYLLGGMPLQGAVLIAASGVFILLCSFVCPPLAKYIFITLSVVTYPIGMVFQVLLLALFYYAIITPFGLFFRLKGRDVLRLKKDPEAETFWIPHKQAKNIKQYFRQY